MCNAVKIPSRLVLAAISLVLALGLCAGSATPQAEAHSTPKICYEVLDANGVWLPEQCDNTIVVPAGGMYGLDVTLKNAGNRHVYYRAYYGGSWGQEAKDGDKIGDGVNPFTGLRILLSPKQGASVCYTLFDMNFVLYDKCDNAIAGDLVTPLRTIQVRYLA